MDSTINAALEEICIRGSAGILLADLWPSLTTVTTTGSVKEAIFSSLISLPCVRFMAAGSSPFDRDKLAGKTAEEWEKLGLRIIAEQHVRDSFLGIDDLKASSSEMSEMQRRVLERLAAARASGITQSDLAREFDIKGNNFFYIVKNLECQQLIVRQSIVLKEKDRVDKVGNRHKNPHISSTNMLRLYRYASCGNLNSQQKVEITRSAWGNVLENTVADKDSFDGDVAAGEGFREDILVKDYLPAMKAICDKLEEASEKVHIISDIKLALGYRRSRHRAWRTTLNRLKDAGLVEVIYAEINNKDVPCLRLLKKFDPNDFQPKMTSSGYDGFDSERLGKHIKRGQITDQHLELPMEHRIYDMVDAEGPKGITVLEVCRRIGLNSKKMYKRIIGMCLKFGMRIESEMSDKTKAFRVWTNRNFHQYSTNASSVIHDRVPDRTELPTKSNELVPSGPSSQDLLLLDSLSQDEVHPEKTQSKVGLQQPSQDNDLTADADVITQKIETQNLVLEFPNVNNNAKVGSSTGIIKSNIVLSENSLPVSSTKQSQSYQGLAPTADATRREQRILTRLKDDKFILICELYRWLNDLKDKPQMMDRKTLKRTLNKLQEEGLCKISRVTVPVATNYNRTREEGVILHPSVDNISSGLLDSIHRRLKLFANESQSRGSIRADNNPTVAGLALAGSSSNHVDQKSVEFEAICANGFVPAKMVRVKLFHYFLWGYLSSLPNWQNTLHIREHNDDQQKHCCIYRFAIKEAIKEMPLQLFLQIVGSTKEIDDMIRKCKAGLKLSDLSVLEYKCLVNDTLATGRLSRLVDILLRLKLIQIVGEGVVEGVDVQPCMVPTHAMELHPYIEEPMPRALDLRPRLRHDFFFSSLEAVGEYWDTLEYCYARADRLASSHAFPGSVVPEVFHPRSWATTRVMTAERRMELLKYLKKGKLSSYKKCAQIAKELNLTVGQVLHVSRFYKHASTSKSKEQEKHMEVHDCGSIPRKKRRISQDEPVKHVDKDSETSVSSCKEADEMVRNSLLPVDIEIHDCPMEDSKDDSDSNTAVDFNSKGEVGQSFTFISQCAFSGPKPTRRKRFLWSDILDRQLIMLYVRQRAVMGERFHRVDWSSLSNLPALPNICRRRMAALRSDKSIRRAMMKLCNLLADRYSRYSSNTLEKETPTQNDGNCIGRAALDEIDSQNTFNGKKSSGSGVRPIWDDFNDPVIQIAVREIIRCKRMAKLKCTKFSGANQVKGWIDNPQTEVKNLDDEEHVVSTEQNSIPSNSGEGGDRHNERSKRNSNTMSTGGRGKSRSRQAPGKFLKLLNSRGNKIRNQVCESLAVANAVELLKLVFLSNSVALQASLAATLQLYSESDLFVAFSYLKEKEFMIVGHGSQPFVLSPKFWHSASSSLFPIDSGKRAVEFSTWLHKLDNDIVDAVELTLDLQCGEIFHLFALVSLDEVLISPCMPKEGIGEADELKGSKSLLSLDNLDGFDVGTSLKRKSDDAVQFRVENTKKQKVQGKMEGELCYRREKGFPGIKVLLTRGTFQRSDVVPHMIDDENQTCLSISEDVSNQSSYPDTQITSSTPSSANLDSSHYFGNNTQSEMPLKESPWDMMAKYAVNLSSIIDGKNKATTLHPELFKSVHSVICQAGEQGLTTEEISKTMGEQGIQLIEVVVDTLGIFKLAHKVNAYDCVKVVDASYRSKYFISMLVDQNQDDEMASSVISQGTRYEGLHQISWRKHDINGNQDARNTKFTCGHKVTPINLPPMSGVPCVGTQRADVNATSGDCNYLDAVSAKEKHSGDNTSVPHVYRSILPWINSDGSTNTIMYKGLTRRVLGAVMQNPGILEDDIIRQMDVLNPQSCRQLLANMVLDNHIFTRMMLQTTGATPPSLLQSLFRSNVSESKSGLRKHYFANPMSTSLL